jgi:AAA15 family ATPase/GTPase
MLLQFTFGNYRSFRDETMFSMVASSGAEHRESHTMPVPGSDNSRAVRSAGIYGPNASGKTNILLALNAMSEIVVKSATAGQRGDDIAPISPFRLKAEQRTSPTSFSASFIVDGVEYEYAFAATRSEVVEESLYAYPKGQARRWFKRSYSVNHDLGKFNPGDYLKGQRQQIWEATRPNALFLSTAVQLNNEQLAPIFDWFRKSIAYLPGRRLGPGFTTDISEDEAEKKRILELLSAADLGIRDMSVEEEPVDFDALPSGLAEFIATSDQKEHVERILGRSIRFQHTDEFEEEALLDLREESHGTQQFFALAGPILHVLDEGRILLVDELDASLHPTMVREILSLFNDPETNPNGAQLIFNTHDLTLLSQDLLRRDQIWFTEKFGDGASRLTPLLEFKPRKGTEALRKNYLQGRYGGLPMPRLKQELQERAHASQ